MKIYKTIINKHLIKICLFQFLLFTTLSVYAHEGEPSHGGDLPVDLGGNRMQYEGRQNLIDIKLSNSSFNPNEVAIDTGGIVSFQNQDQIDHRILFSMGEEDDDEVHDHPVGGHERSHIIKSEKHWVLEFLVPGLFLYQCTIHGETGQIYVKY